MRASSRVAHRLWTRSHTLVSVSDTRHVQTAVGFKGHVSNGWLPTRWAPRRGPGTELSGAAGAQVRLVGALRGLVLLERLRRVDVTQRRVTRRHLARDADVEPLREHCRQRSDLHVAVAGQRSDALLQIRP